MVVLLAVLKDIFMYHHSHIYLLKAYSYLYNFWMTAGDGDTSLKSSGLNFLTDSKSTHT